MRKALVSLIFKVNNLRLINNQEAKSGFSKAKLSGFTSFASLLHTVINGKAEIVEASDREETVSQPS